jgi:hypothetical protein
MINTTNPWGILWAIQAEHECFWKNKWNHVSEKWSNVPFTKEDIDDMELCEVSELLDDHLEGLPNDAFTQLVLNLDLALPKIQK